MPMPGRVGSMSARSFGFASLSVPDVISFVGYSESSASTISAPGGIASGDYGVIFDQAFNSSGVIPTSVTPTGFTAIGTSQTYTNGLSVSIRWNMSFKILAGTETTITGMSSASDTKRMLVFRKTTGTWGSASSVGNELAIGGITSKTVTVGTAPLVIIGCTPSSTISMSPAGTYVGASADMGYLIYQSGASNNTVDDGSPGALCIGCFYVAVS